MSDTVKVRTTIQPDQELEVGPQEYADLKGQGLLLNTKATTDEGARRAAVRQVENKEN
jgi:hypothetical protein